MHRAVRGVFVVVLAFSCVAVAGAHVARAAGSDPVLSDAARSVLASQVAAAGQPNAVMLREARDRSRQAFRGLTPAGARRVLLEQHRGVVLRPGWLRPGQLSAWADAEPLAPNVLRVRGTVGPDSLVLTSEPVAYRDDAGRLQKIDLGLRQTGGGDLLPDSAPFPLALPESLEDGIAVGEGGRRFSIVPAVANGGDASVEGYGAFYGDVDRDADFVAKPVLGGVETYSILRSPASPETLRLRLDGGVGSVVLPSTTVPGFGLWRGGRELAVVSPPQAWDAEHRPVPVQASVEGVELVMHVDHRDRDVAYPIVVDPTVVGQCYAYIDWYSGCEVDAWESISDPTFNSGYAGWQYGAPAGGRFAQYYGDGYLGRGLYIRDMVQNYYTQNEAGYWVYGAPYGVRIWSALFSNLSQDNPPDNLSCLFVGVVQNGGVWERSSPATYCGQRTIDQAWIWCPGTSCADTSGGTPSNAALFGAMAQRTGWSSYWMDHMGGIAIGMTEMNWANLNPYISSPDFPDDWQTDPNHSVTIHVGDAGLGLRSIAFSSLENSAWQAIDADTGGSANRTYACFGGTRLACPTDVWIHMKLGNLPEGFSTIRVRATDMVGKTYTYQHTIAIQYYWASAQYGGANATVDTAGEVDSVVNAMAATSNAGRQALWGGLNQASRDYYVNSLLPDARQLREDFGLSSSDAATRAVFADPTTHGTIADLGTPLTTSELAFVSDDSAPSWAYDGAPSPDVLASTYSVSTDDGAALPDSTGNRGCDPATESCPDANETLTSTDATPSDPVTDDLDAVTGMASSKDAVDAGAASSGFDRYRARADADAHALTPRSGLYSPFNDSDCTNFVSQVWHLGGGLPMKSGWMIRWRRGGGVGARSYRRPWALVRDFVDYMVNKRQTSRLVNADITSYNLPAQASIADAVEYDWGEGWSHLAVAVKTNTSIDNVSQHSINRRESLWNLGWVNQRNVSIRARMKARVVHLRAP